MHIRPSCMLIYILFWLRLAGTKPSPPGAQDILSRFNGSWALHPLRSEDGSAVVGTAAVLEQDILPAGAVTLSPPENPTTWHIQTQCHRLESQRVEAMWAPTFNTERNLAALLARLLTL